MTNHRRWPSQRSTYAYRKNNRTLGLDRVSRQQSDIQTASWLRSSSKMPKGLLQKRSCPLLRLVARPYGFTLVELMVVLAVLAILVTIGLPSFAELIKDNRTAAQSRELNAILTFARSEAIRRNDDVSVQLTSITGGWEAEVIDSANNRIREATHDRVTLTVPGGGLQLTLNFTNRGYLQPFNSQGFCLQHTAPPCARPRQHRFFEVEATGQLQTTPIACGVCSPNQ